MNISVSDSVVISESVSTDSIRYSADSGANISGTMRDVRGNS